MTDLPAALVAYLEQRDAARADAVRAFLASLTDRERALIRDAAVMGYVRGRMHPQDDPHPKDSHVLAEVVDACLAFPDLYPAVNAEPAAVQAQLATLTEAERTMLTYALDQAQERIWSEDGFTDEDQAAVTSLRRLAAGVQQQ